MIIEDNINECRCFIEFKFNDIKVFNKINKLFSYIKEVKNEQIQIDDLEYRLFEIIDDFYEVEELEYFWWPTEAERYEFWNKYKELPESKRYEHLNSVPCDFETVFNEIGEGEYIICECRITQENLGRLYYEPFSYPYGGSEMLEEAVKSLGGEAIKIFG